MHALALWRVNASAGHFYALEGEPLAGPRRRGRAAVGVAPYTDDADVDRLLSGLDTAVTPRCP
jgi:selenocysteine lyase/cysteine desulfurase